MREAAGGDEDLYSEVLRMLEEHERHGILDDPPWDAAAVTESASDQPVFPPGELLSGRYRIVRFLGRGGMGEVYEAEDLELRERVALKTLLPAIAHDGRMIARFKQEILLSRRVSHPNVCRVFDLARHPADGSAPPAVVFLTMEFLPGETLSARLHREGSFSPEEALPILAQAADALDAAHQAGVIHRDFKPSNVMLVPSAGGTRAVVTDFGLARSYLRSGEITATLTGTRMGTVEYMAPELAAFGTASTASDVYAFGAVAYKMVTGSLPFAVDSPIAGSIPRPKGAPPSPRDLVPDLDQRWEQAILRALDPDPARRFPKLGDFLEVLNGEAAAAPPLPYNFTRRTLLAAIVAAVVLLLSAGAAMWRPWQPALPKARNLAVLPFRSSGNAVNSQAFSEGLIESLIGRLSQLERFDDSFSVVPTLEFRGRTVRSVSDARRAFGVSLVLEGSLAYENQRIRLTLTVLDAQTAQSLASRTIGRDAGQSAGLLDEAFDFVVKTLQLRVPTESLREIAAGGTASAAAFDACQQGIGLIRRPGIPQLDDAIALFQSALQRDSGYALAYAGLGEAYADKYELKKDPEFARQARLNGERAVALNDRLASTHLALGQVNFRTGRMDAANREFLRTLDLDPASYYGHYWLARSLDGLGRQEEAEKAYLATVNMRPSYWLGHSGLGSFYYQHGQYSKAEPNLRRALDLAPDNYIGFASLGGVYLAMGLYDAAEAVLKKSLGMKESVYAESNLGAVYLMLERYSDAGAMLEKATKLNPNDPRVWRNLGDAYRFSGKSAQANDCFRKAIVLVEKQLSVNPVDAQALANLALYHAKLGDRVTAEGALRRALAGSGVDADVHFKAAIVYALAGQTPSALNSLKAALDAGVSREQVIKEPELAPVRADSRFSSILNRSNKAREGEGK